MSVDCLKRRRYAALVGLGRPFCLGPWDEGEDPVHSSLSGFDTRTMPRTRHVWGTRQSRWLRTADGFAVSGRVLDVDQRRRLRSCCWIMSRALQQWTRRTSKDELRPPEVWWPSFETTPSPSLLHP